MNTLSKEMFSKNLSYLLIKNGKRQIDLARDLKIPKATVSSWCKGNRMPKLTKLNVIASYLNLDNPVYLLMDNIENVS